MSQNNSITDQVNSVTDTVITLPEVFTNYIAMNPATVIGGGISAIAGIKTLLYYMQGKDAYDKASAIFTKTKNISLLAQEEKKMPLLHRVAQQGDLVLVKEIIENLKVISKFSKTPMNNYIDMEYKGKTPLCLAASSGKKATARYLISHGASVTIQDNNGETPLFRAIIHGSEDIVRTLLEEDNKKPSFRLLQNIISGENKPNRLVDITNNMGYSPLLVAIFSGQLEISKLILRHNCLLTANHEGLDPYQAALRAGIPGFREFAKEDIFPLLSDEYKQPFKTDLNYGEKNSARRGPLYYAVLKSDLGKVKSCLEKGESMLTKDKYGGIYPLALAAQSGNPEILKLFLPYFEDKHRKAIQKTTGLSPIHIVLRAKQSENRLLSLKTLVEDFKFYPDCGSNSGVRPLQRAIEQGDIEVVKFLLETGKVNINSQDCRGNTPLHYAARSNQPEVAKLLLLNGAVALFRHHEFRTPEEIAKILENHEVLDVFQKWEKWSRTDSFALSYWQHKVDSKMDIANYLPKKTFFTSE